MRRIGGKNGTPDRLKSAFIGPKGPRAGWMLALSWIACAAISLGLYLGLAALFDALFLAWGVNAGNVGRAPRWAQWLFGGLDGVISLAISLALIALSAALRRLWLRKGWKRGWPDRAAALALLAGLATTILPVALYLLADSLRLSRVVHLSAMTPVWLIGSFFILLGEETFTRRVIQDGVADRWGSAWAVVLSTLTMFAMNRGWNGNAAGIVNVLLLGVLAAMLHQMHGFWAALGLRFGWSMGTGLVFGRSGTAILRPFGVSENWLTGGDGGLIFGWGETLVLLVALLWLGRRELRSMARRLRKAG